MTRMGKTAILEQPDGSFVVREAPVPEPKAGQALIRQELCGVCGTDVHVYHGHLPGTSYPITLGHEAVGIVDRLGAGVTTDYAGRPVRKGDRVAVFGGLVDRTCYFCSVVREPTLCTGDLGCYGLGIPGVPLDFQGGYAQYIYLSQPGSAFLKINAPAEAAIFFDPLAVAIHAVERIANLPVAATVAIQGVGAIGIAALVAARERGANRIITIGAPESRLSLARDFGADVTIDIEQVRDPTERVHLVRAETPGRYGADAVLECTGVPLAIPEGIDMVRRGGSYVVLGHFTDVGEVAINPFRHFNHKQLCLHGSWGCHVGEMIRACNLIEAGKHDYAALISHRLPLERAQDAMVALSTEYRLDGKEIRKIAIDAWL